MIGMHPRKQPCTLPSDNFNNSSHIMALRQPHQASSKNQLYGFATHFLCKAAHSNTPDMLHQVPIKELTDPSMPASQHTTPSHLRGSSKTATMRS